MMTMTKRKTIAITDRARAAYFAWLVLPLLGCLALAFAHGQVLKKHYGLIFGTAYGPDDRPLYGVRVKVRPAGKNRPSWELLSDHRGEFAQRVPPGPADYVIAGEVEVAEVENGKTGKKKKLQAEAKVHIDAEERQDVGLHLAERKP